MGTEVDRMEDCNHNYPCDGYPNDPCTKRSEAMSTGYDGGFAPNGYADQQKARAEKAERELAEARKAWEQEIALWQSDYDQLQRESDEALAQIERVKALVERWREGYVHGFESTYADELEAALKLDND